MGSSHYLLRNELMLEYLQMSKVMLVYCRMDLPNANNLRQEYLRFIGNDSNNICPIHHLLLVTKPLNKLDKCCKVIASTVSKEDVLHSRCTRTAAFRCPWKKSAWEHCRFMVCKKCNTAAKIKISERGQQALVSDMKQHETPQEKAFEINSNLEHHSPSTLPQKVMLQPTTETVKQTSIPQDIYFGPSFSPPIQYGTVDQWLAYHQLRRVTEYKYTYGNCLYDSVSYVMGHIGHGRQLRSSCLSWGRQQLETHTEIGDNLVDFFHSMEAMEENETYNCSSVEEYLILLDHNIEVFPTTLDVYLICGFCQIALEIYEPSSLQQLPNGRTEIHPIEFCKNDFTNSYKIWHNEAHYEPIVHTEIAMKSEPTTSVVYNDFAMESCDEVASVETVTKFHLTTEAQEQDEETQSLSQYSDQNYFSQESIDDSVILPPFVDLEDESCESIDNLSEASNNSKESWEHLLDHMPTTNAAKTAKNIVNQDKDPSSFKLSMHVLLNEHGSLLQRSRIPLSPSRRQKQLLEGIVASTSGQSIPLLFPEAMLFPAIFWKQHADGSYDGAIPVSFLNHDDIPNSHGYASITDHLLTRITSPDLLCSTLPEYLYFAFDTIHNLSSQGRDSRLLIKRGYEHMYDYIHNRRHLTSGGYSESITVSDAIDSRRTVQNLAAMMKEKDPTWFYTHTCNQSTHFGIAPIRTLLMEQLEELKSRMHKMSDLDYEQHVKALHHMAAVQITRTWTKVGEAYIDYIVNSPEKPFGTIEWHWNTKDYNEASGNLPHFHCLFWTKEDKANPDDLKFLQEKVVCSLRNFLPEEDVQRYVREGLIPNNHCATCCDILDDVNRFQQHNCAAAKYRCHKRVGMGKNETQCRVINYFEISNDPNRYGYKNINPNHNEEALKIFCELELFDEQGKPVHPRMKAGRYTYPATKGMFFKVLHLLYLLFHVIYVFYAIFYIFCS